MDLRLITTDIKLKYNSKVNHIMQSWEWGEFRKKLGLPLLRYGIYKKDGKTDELESAFTLTLHQIPFFNSNVGYFPKGEMPTKELATALEILGKNNNCAFIKLEPNVEKGVGNKVPNNFKISPKPLFTKHNFVLDLTSTEDELLANMHQKTRYNIRLAQKKGVTVEERVDDKAFEIYLDLYFQTTQRQNYFGHNKTYHKLAWETLKASNMARILIAYHEGIPLTAWMLYNFKDTLYYPYGGSSTLHRDTMSSNLVAWEAIKLGKKLKLKQFDMWGALGPEADPKDPWFGFHRFKQGYGGKLVEYIGTYDLVFNYPLYLSFTSIDKFTKLKVILLKLLGK